MLCHRTLTSEQKMLSSSSEGPVKGWGLKGNGLRHGIMERLGHRL